MIPYLQRKPVGFPDPETALNEPDGILAAGGDLTTDWLLTAYSNGIFPWYNEPPIFWWSPAERPIIEPSQVRINRSLKRTIRHTLRDAQITFTLNHAFLDVIRACAEPRFIEGELIAETWINPDMIKAYHQLHKINYAHSIEMWREHELIGGMYGVQIGANFFGESMFSRESDASKLCFVVLCKFFEQHGGLLIDCQMTSDHMERLGAESISRSEFLKLIHDNQQIDCPQIKGKHNLKLHLP